MIVVLCFGMLSRKYFRYTSTSAGTTLQPYPCFSCSTLFVSCFSLNSFPFVVSLLTFFTISCLFFSCPVSRVHTDLVTIITTFYSKRFYFTHDNFNLVLEGLKIFTKTSIIPIHIFLFRHRS